LKHLKKLKGKNAAMDSINMLKIAEHINEDSSEHRSYGKGQDIDDEQNEKAEKAGDNQNAASPPRSGGSEADMKATSVQQKSKDSQGQLQSA